MDRYSRTFANFTSKFSSYRKRIRERKSSVKTKTRLLALRNILKRFDDNDVDKVLTHALGLSSLVYFSVPFIGKILSKHGYKYTTLEHEGMLCLIVETTEQIYISFRGTMPSKISNWKKILNVFPKYFMYDLKAHGGFVIYHNKYKDYINSYIDTIDHTKDIIFTGHSLGAAIASLYNISYTKSSKCICFASPNILFNSPFNSLSSNSYQINMDFVTKIPFSLPLLKWTIPTNSLGVKSNYKGINPFTYHSLDNYIRSICIDIKKDNH